MSIKTCMLAALTLFALASADSPANALPAAQNPISDLLQGESGSNDAAQNGAQGNETRNLDRASIQNRLASSEEELAETQGRAEEARAEGAEELLSDLTEIVEVQQQRVLLYERQLQLLNDTDELLELAKSAVDDYALTTGASNDNAGDVPILEHDELWDQLQIALEQVAVVADETVLEKEGQEDAKRAIADRERETRRRREDLEGASDPVLRAELSRGVLLAELREETATATFELRTLRIEQASAQQSKLEAVVELLQARLDRTESRIIFEEETRQELNRELEELEASLEELQREAFKQERVFDSRWMSSNESVNDSTPEEPFLPLYREELETASQAKRRWKTEAQVLAIRIGLLGQRRTLWDKRWRAVTGTADADEIKTFVSDSRAALKELNSDEQSVRVRLEPLRKQIRLLQTVLEGPEEGDPRIRDEQRLQGDELAAQVGALEDRIAGIEAVRRLHRLIIDHYGIERRSFSMVMRDVWSWIKRAWTSELYVSKDETTVIRVWQAVTGLFLLLFAFKAAGILTRFIGAHVLPRFGIQPAAAVAIRTILFYLLIVTFVLLALRTINVPLTAFTVLGGALAIGVGFGSQNIVNNFISGLILLVEQPIRVGDLIQLDDLYGTVERVGARSTRVRTGQNVEILVPNSSFLESNVINLTLTDNKIRTHVTVGVAYGTQVRDVVRLMKTAAEEHGRVLNSPEPRVIFADFGDNALAFELHFWIRTNQVMDRRMIESDIRSKIDAVFRGANISIAFPQRDIHLDLSEPLRVEMVPPTDSTGAALDQDGQPVESEKPDKPNLPG